MSGTLYIVATPIGNLEDMSFRAVRILKEASVIACEDTRQTRKLLDHYGISTRLVSYHDFNEQQRSDELIRDLESGKTVALVSDAGTPLIADPGYRVVQKARAKGLTVSPIPGASAIVAALSASGLATDEFEFRGFFAAKRTQRRKVLEGIVHTDRTVAFYEAPHRILETLDDIAAILPGRPLVLAREMTKMHEEFLAGAAGEIRQALESRTAIKGEFTVLIGKGAEPARPQKPVVEAVADLMAAGASRMDAYKQVARERGLSKRDVYRECEQK